MQTVELGDIVLVNNGDGTQSPAIVTSIIDQDHVTLDTFGVGGVGGSTIPVQRGTGNGQWQPRPKDEH